MTDIHERNQYGEYPSTLRYKKGDEQPHGEFRTRILRQFGEDVIHDYTVVTTWDYEESRIEVVFDAAESSLNSRGWSNPVYSAQYLDRAIWRDALKVHHKYCELLNG